jgi:predicted transcriptional regulator
MMSEDGILNFAAVSLNSVWALELLLVLKRDPARTWDADEIIRELRSSEGVVAEALGNLMTARLAAKNESGRYRYQAAAAGLDEMVAELEKLYATKPTAVIRAIVTAPNRKLQILSNAFRFKE